MWEYAPVAGRRAPTLLIVGTLVASLMSTNAFMGESGIAYSGFPFIVILLTAINVIGYVAGALFFGRFLRRSRSLTLAEYFGDRFNSQRVRLVAVSGASNVLGSFNDLPAICEIAHRYGARVLVDGAQLVERVEELGVELPVAL